VAASIAKRLVPATGVEHKTNLPIGKSYTK